MGTSRLGREVDSRFTGRGESGRPQPPYWPWARTARGSGALPVGGTFVQCAHPLVSRSQSSWSRPPQKRNMPEPTSSVRRQQLDEEPRMSTSVTKGPDRSRGDEAKPHDFKVLVHATWSSNIPLSPIWTPTGRFPEESSAAPSVNTVVSAPILIFRKHSYPTPATRLTKIIDGLDKNLRPFRMNIMTTFNVVD